jgi:kynureninase
VRLTAYLERCIDAIGRSRVEIITPREPARRGVQLSLRVPGAERLRASLERAGCICDFRPPDVIRVAPTPLYNTFEDIAVFARALAGEEVRA